jgi:hypothetical protein
MARIDQFGTEVQGIDNKHGLVHAGKLFSGCFVRDALAGAGVHNFVIVPTLKTLHLTDIILQATKSCDIYIIPDATSYSGGTPVTLTNRTNVNPKTMNATFVNGATTITGGTPVLIGRIRVASGGPPSTLSPARIPGDIEWYFRPGQLIVFRIINGADSNDLDMTVVAYER